MSSSIPADPPAPSAYAHGGAGALFTDGSAGPSGARALADAVPLILWTCAPDGRPTSLNPQWEAYTGQTTADGLARGTHPFVHPDDLGPVHDAWRRHLPGGERAGADFTFEYRLRAKSGQYRWHLGRVVARRGAGGEVLEWVGTGTDIHDHKAAEEALADVNARLRATGAELQQANARLQAQAAELAAANAALRGAAAELEERTVAAERARAEADRAREAAEAANQAKAQFLATMSHELRTPLNAIAGYVQLVDMGLHGPVTPGQQAALGRVAHAQRHLLGLINDVLNYAKLESGRVEYEVRAVDVRDVVAEVAPLVEPQLAARALAFDVVLPATLPPVWADHEKLRQILLNLLSNAIKFTEPGGRVLVDVAARGTGGGPGDAVFLRVTDTGAGVARERQERIFEPFVQVRPTLTRPHEGTGLGLAISRDLARGMGGDLRVRSAPPLGSTFTLTLRRAVDDEGRPTERRVGVDRRDDDERRAPRDRRRDDAGRAGAGPGAAE